MSHNRRAFTLIEVMTTLLIMAIIVNIVVVTYLRADRANDCAMVSLERLLTINQTLAHLRQTIRGAEAILPARDRWRSDEATLVLRLAGGRTMVLTRRDEALAEFDADQPDSPPLLRPLHADDIRFDYGGQAPAEARLVGVTLALKPVWPDTVDRLVLRTAAAVRAAGRESR